MSKLHSSLWQFPSSFTPKQHVLQITAYKRKINKPTQPINNTATYLNTIIIRWRCPAHGINLSCSRALSYKCPARTGQENHRVESRPISQDTLHVRLSTQAVNWKSYYVTALILITYGPTVSFA